MPISGVSLEAHSLAGDLCVCPGESCGNREYLDQGGEGRAYKRPLHVGRSSSSPYAPGGKLAPVSGGHLCTASEPANNVTVPYGVRSRGPIPESLQTESEGHLPRTQQTPQLLHMQEGARPDRRDVQTGPGGTGTN